MEELFDKICIYAIKKKASDIHLNMKESLIIDMRIQGELIHYITYDTTIGKRLLNYIKYRSKLNTNLMFQPQTGMCRFHYKSNYDLRVSYLPSNDGESIVIRILDTQKTISIHEITQIDEILNFYLNLSHIDSGLVLFSGATGSGKSTTLYTLMDDIYQKTHKNIISIEDPIEVIKDYCVQIELNETIGIDYASTLKQILRHDPDIIVIGEIRDDSVANIAITCALTGHLVLSTIHASNAVIAIQRLLNMNVSKLDIESTLIASVSQRLRYNDDQVIILSEYLDSNGIRCFLNNKPFTYNTFNENARLLIKHYQYDQRIFSNDL